MKFLRLFFFAALVLFAASCDNAETCVQSDWLGNYTGTVNCDGSTDDATISITASGTEAIIIAYTVGDSTVGITTTYDAITPEDCSLSYNDSDSNFSLEVTASVDGDNFTFKDVTTVISTNETFTCDITATRD